MNKLTLFLFLSCICLCTHAQKLTSNRNYYRSGDKIIKQQVEFKDPGPFGKEITWDFSQLKIVNEKYQLAYFFPSKKDSSNAIGIEHQTRYLYKLKSDTLWLTGYENYTTKMEYQHPEALIRFPFRYEDTLRSKFCGKGLFCKKVHFVAKGNTTVIADAMGMLITPERDTLKQVMRVLRIKEFSDIGLDSTRMRMETYQWYANGSRYPIFETVKSFVIGKDSTTKNFFTSFYFTTLKREELLEDLANIKEPDNAINPDEILINCVTYPNPVVNELTVKYELSIDAQVSFQLCDISGRPWATVSNRVLSAGKQQQKISMSGLHFGDYVLYIKINEKVFRRMLIKS